jgi:hypothetical protein
LAPAESRSGRGRLASNGRCGKPKPMYLEALAVFCIQLSEADTELATEAQIVSIVVNDLVPIEQILGEPWHQHAAIGWRCGKPESVRLELLTAFFVQVRDAKSAVAAEAQLISVVVHDPVAVEQILGEPRNQHTVFWTLRWAGHALHHLLLLRSFRSVAGGLPAASATASAATPHGRAITGLMALQLPLPPHRTNGFADAA